MGSIGYLVKNVGVAEHFRMVIMQVATFPLLGRKVLNNRTGMRNCAF